MTIIHKGVRRRTTDIIDDYGMAYYAQNVRYRRAGEMGRRGGIGKTSMAQQAGPVLLIGCGSYFEPYVVQMVGGDVIATANPTTKWAEPILVTPDGQVGTPAAPTIVSVTPDPLSPPATYVIGAVTFTAAVTYDGLSGALSYSWTTPTDGVNTAAVITNNANPASFNFDASCTPGNYSYTLTVSTALNGFSTQLITSYTVL